MIYRMFSLTAMQLYTSTRKENIDSCLHLINRDLDIIDSRASANGLCINPSKFKCIMLSRTNFSFVIPGLSIKGNKTDFVKSATNLGIELNDRLSWSNHIYMSLYSMLRLL